MNKKELPNVIEFDAVKKGKSSKEFCECGRDAKLIIDEENMIVECSVCGGEVPPFKALVDIAENNSLFYRQLRKLEEQKDQLQAYQPHKPIIKTLEKNLIESEKGKVNLGTKYYPCCPNCNEPFELNEITHKWKGGIFIQQKLITRQNKQRKDKKD